MIYNHIKSWNTHLNHRGDIYVMHGFFMAERRSKCPEKQERKTVTGIETKNIKEITI